MNSPSTETGSVRHRVVVVGGGFGGLPACRLLGRKPVDVTLLDRRNHHLFQPLLYHVATGILSEGQIAVPLRQTLHRYENIRVELAEVTGFDLDRRVVFATSPLHDPVEVPYDSLSGRRRRPVVLRTRRARPVRAGHEDPRRRARAPPPDLRRVRNGRDDQRPDQTTGVAAAKALEKLGIELRMGSLVTGIDANGVDVKTSEGTERIAARVVVWAAGVQASPLATMLAEASGAETDRAGRIATLPDLTLPGHPEVFAVGDMVTLNNLPGVAEVAMQGSLHAANSIVRRLDGKDTKPYTYRDVGSVAAIGRFRAICNFHGLRLSGFAAWIVWLFVHLTFLNGFGNRLAALWRWFWAMVGRQRHERIFSVAHTGGDLSAPDSVRTRIAPLAFPAMADPGEPEPKTVP
jgi:NADH dehydrogenase